MRRFALFVFVVAACGGPMTQNTTANTNTPIVTSSADGGTFTCNGPPSTCAGGKNYRCVTNADVTSCHYVTSDGATYSCASCNDCSAAIMQAAQWCSQSSSSGSGGLTCNAVAAPCGSSGRSMRFCTSDDASSNCRYVTGDGTVFMCTTCQDCASAAIAVAQWCH